MARISQQEKSDLRRRFRKELKRDVTIHFFTTAASLLSIPGRDCPTCPQTQELLEDLVSLSPKLHLKRHDFFSQPEERDEFGVERIPGIVLQVDNEPTLKFYGVPAGYEFATILEDLKVLSRGVSPLALETRKSLRKVNQPVHIQVFVTPACPRSPTLARLAHAMALENKLIGADVVEIQEFPSLARMYGVTTVPKTVINNVIQFDGLLPEGQMLENVLQVGYREPDPSVVGGK